MVGAFARFGPWPCFVEREAKLRKGKGGRRKEGKKEKEDEEENKVAEGVSGGKETQRLRRMGRKEKAGRKRR